MNNVITNWRLPLIVFFSGAILMIYELVGTRVTAPMVGNSLYTWTAIIGAILACLSLGNYLGGILADRFSDTKTLSFILLYAALFVSLTNSIADILIKYFFNIKSTPEIQTTLFALILFGPAAIFLGMVSPYGMKLTLTNLSQTGKQAGLLYMFSTVGSIVGTFLAGFVLIPWLGTEQLVLILAITLIAVSILADKYISLFKLLFIGIILLVISLRYLQLSQSKVVDIDTAYQRVKVFEFFDPQTKSKMVGMAFDSKGVQSLKYKNNFKLASNYTQLMQAYKSVNPTPKRALFIGGAGYAMPSYLFHTNDKVEIDVVEIDPKITQLAKDYFDLTNNRRLKSIHQDGRLYLQQTKEKYDLVMLDAFGGEGLVPPFHLITKENFELIASVLSDEGVVVINIISPLRENNFLYKSVYSTVDSVFEKIVTLGVLVDEPEQNQNIILVASKNDFNFNSQRPYEYSDIIYQSRWNEVPAKSLVLTDNYAPIEYLERQGRRE